MDFGVVRRLVLQADGHHRIPGGHVGFRENHVSGHEVPAVRPGDGVMGEEINGAVLVHGEGNITRPAGAHCPPGNIVPVDKGG
ncbi:hypothetical protein SDC9_42084 [bioreactor metagenome]|uniref:Uncharacterized protein n=1 Tax=bioreactor metagenome TaxID=1076179 RepID=A0A644VWW6_9ZZZZ